MARIGLQALSAPEVELPGEHVYTITPATKAVHAKAEQFQAKLTGLGDDPDTNEAVDLYCQLLDVRLVAVEKGQPRASTVMRRLWDADKVTLLQLLQFVEDIGATDRPT
jgi:hypothetical protein